MKGYPVFMTISFIITLLVLAFDDTDGEAIRSYLCAIMGFTAICADRLYKISEKKD